MKITKRQLRQLIMEEKKILLKEYGAMSKESGLPLITFAQAWSGLGGAVQEQMIDMINGFIENNEEAVYEMNPNALDEAYRQLGNSLNVLGQSNPDAEEVMEAIEWAQGIFQQGEDEVESDARAAGDR